MYNVLLHLQLLAPTPKSPDSNLPIKKSRRGEFFYEYHTPNSQCVRTILFPARDMPKHQEPPDVSLIG